MKLVSDAQTVVAHIVAMRAEESGWRGGRRRAGRRSCRHYRRARSGQEGKKEEEAPEKEKGKKK